MQTPQDFSPNLGNKRVRGTKPGGDAPAAGGDATAAERRAAALAQRQARSQSVADGNHTPLYAGKRTRAAELHSDAGDAGELELERPLKSKSQKVAAVAELLRDGFDDDDAGDGADELEAGDEPGDAGQETGNEPRAQTLDAIAETLGVDVADLWDAEFRDSAGKTHKLGALKDLLQANTDHDARELEFAERKSADENDLMRQRQELDYILRSLPKAAVTPELTTRAKAERDRVLKLEAERIAAAIPEWRNAETRRTERTAIGEWMRQYGFGAGDLERMFDHRMQKLLRDSWQRQERVNKALAKVKEQRGAPSRPARAQNGQRRAKAPTIGPNATRTEKVSAVAHLLRSGT
jgi:hypothetical protein